MTTPPPVPSVRKKSRLPKFLIAGGAFLLVLVVVGVVLGIRFVSEHGLTERMDQKFGDQHLKSSVALLELHNIRFGRYPDSLRDLRYAGEWDLIWIGGMRYYPSEDRMSYYIEVGRGWVGMPTLNMPEEFWQNTGYDEALRPTNE